MKFTIFLALFIFAGQLSCATSSQQNKNLSLLKVKNLYKKTANFDLSRSFFGAPHRTLEVPNNPSELAWLYFQGEYKATPRLSLIFDKATGSLKRYSWHVRDGERERQAFRK